MLRAAEPEPSEAKVILRWTQLVKNSTATHIRNEELRGGSVSLVGCKIYMVASGGHLILISSARRADADAMREESAECAKWSVEKLETRLLGVQKWHIAQLVEDKILYYGGEGSTALIEFDTVLERAREVATNDDGPGGRKLMTSVYAPWRNEIITFGGSMENSDNEQSNETHAFNIQSSLWRKLKLRGEPPEARNAHAAVLHGSKMYVYGGYGGDNRLLGDLWIAELGSFRAPCWAQLKPRGLDPSFCAKATIHFLNGYIVSFGGISRESNTRRDVEIYFPRPNEWRKLESSAGAVIEDEAPAQTSVHIALSTANQIVCITSSGIYALSQV